ncbi:MAG: Mov34/MPN/PAD-1 family protein [Planctomycetales bacterium]
MTATTPTPDVSQLQQEGLAPQDFPAGRRRDFRVHFAPEVHAQILQHAGESHSLEICGVLVGDWRQDDGGPFVSISASLRCDQAKSKFAEVTFTHDAWAKVNAEMDTRYADRRIVGWYHSHPDFGIFLSDRDVFIHQHFFSGPGQVAFVVDPVRKTEGVFTWQGGKPLLTPDYWIGSRIRTSDAAARSPTDAQPGESMAPVQAVQGSASLFSGVLSVATLAALFLGGYLLASVRSDWERRTLIEGAAAHYGIWKGLRPELSLELGAAHGALGGIENKLRPLAAEHLKLLGEEAKPARQQWDEIRSHLHDTRRLLEEMGRAYALSEEERSTLERILADRLADLARAARKGEVESKEEGDASQESSAGDSPRQEEGQPPEKKPKERSQGEASSRKRSSPQRDKKSPADSASPLQE